MKNNDEEKVYIRLVKEPLESERREMREKKINKIITFVLTVSMLMIGLVGGYAISYFTNESSSSNTSINKDYEEILQYLNKYWVYKDNYEDLNSEVLDLALYGIAFEEDPYTSYMSIDEYQSFTDDINMDYVGIGVRYTALGGYARIIEVFDGSSAEEAGVLPGDIITKVGDVKVTEEIAGSLRPYITGVEGTYVDITVYRNGQEITLNVKRRAYNTTVSAYQEKDYLVLTLSSFGLTSADEIEAILKKYPDIKKIIIDLRDDTGGYQIAVEEIAGLFIGANQIYMQETYADGSVSYEKTPSFTNQYTFDKIVILTNGNSASCSEVLVGCLKDYFPDLKIVGTNTYGKGVVQTPFTLSSGSLLKMTTSFWSTPNGTNIHGVGFAPDYYVERAEILDSAILEFGNTEYEIDSVSNYNLLVQKALDYLGYEIDRCDGYFDESLKIAINDFQKNHNLKVTGTINHDTYYSVMSEVTYVNGTDRLKDIQLQKAIEIIEEWKKDYLLH